MHFGYHWRNLKIIFANILLLNRGCYFEVKGVFVRDYKIVLQNVQSPKIKYLPFCDKRDQTQPIKKNWSESLKLNSRRKRKTLHWVDVNMRKGEMQIKVKNSFKEKKNVQMNFLNPEQIDWQPNLSIKDKTLQLN